MRGAGLIGGRSSWWRIKAARRNFDPKRKMVIRWAKLCEAHGVIARGLSNDSLAFSPPLIMTEPEVNEMLDRIGAALDELTVQVRREGLAAA